MTFKPDSPGEVPNLGKGFSSTEKVGSESEPDGYGKASTPLDQISVRYPRKLYAFATASTAHWLGNGWVVQFDTFDTNGIGMGDSTNYAVVIKRAWYYSVTAGVGCGASFGQVIGAAIRIDGNPATYQFLQNLDGFARGIVNLAYLAFLSPGQTVSVIGYGWTLENWSDKTHLRVIELWNFSV